MKSLSKAAVMEVYDCNLCVSEYPGKLGPIDIATPCPLSAVQKTGRECGFRNAVLIKRQNYGYCPEL
jgi:hypothetical protein